MIIIHDMLKVLEMKPANISDDELAAVMAALAIVTQPQPTVAVEPEKVSGWKKAALIEGARRKNIRSIDQLVTLSVALVSLLALSLPVGAQDLNTSNVMPPVAPDAGRQQQMQQPQQLQRPQVQQRIRVALQLDAATSTISLPDGGVIRDATTGDTIAELPAQSQWVVTSNAPGGFARICFDGTLLNAASSGTKIAAMDSAYQPVAYYSPAASYADGAKRLEYAGAPSGTQSTSAGAQGSPNGTQSTSAGAQGAPAGAQDLRSLPPSATPRFALPAQGHGYAIVPSTGDGTVGVSGKLFRGALLVQQHANSKTNGVDVINNLELEDYLLSVVPSEMPSGWPVEALKAQAIAARSYAVANMGKHGADGYDVKATVDDQAYAGVSAEHAESTQAVIETRGEVVEYNGKPISAFFHSCSGGFTELAENVWSRPVPYLKAVPDYDDEAPNFAWTRSVNVAAAEQALAKAGRDVGSLLSLQPVMRGVSPRVRYLMASGTNGTYFVTGEEARKLFNLPSTAFNVGGAPDSYVFAGRGYGHGLGMSQYGAKKLAESGWAAPEILSYYYKDVTVNQF